MRVSVFKVQQMGYSTKFHIGKFIVVLKTLAYYFKLMLFPKRMGLYHKFGYHYEMPAIETEDKWFWSGCGVLAISVAGFFFAPFPVKLGITLLYAFLVLFMNWVVVHQFVSHADMGSHTHLQE